MQADGTPMGWPWSPEWWKPKGSLRDLTRSGALLLAEKERRQRAKWDADTYIVDLKLAEVIGALGELK